MDADARTAQLRQPPFLRWLLAHARLVLAIYWTALIVGSHWPRLDLGTSPISVIQLDKIIHSVSMAGLTLLLFLARPLGRSRSAGLTALAACLIAGTYAILDEYSQTWFERVVSVADLAANGIGVLAMYLILTARPTFSRWRNLPVYISRAFLLLAVPTLVAITVLPSGHATVGWLIRYVTDPTRNLDKVLHFLLSAGLTWLLALAAPAGRGRPRLSTALTVVLMVSSAPLIELLQQWSGRGFELDDVYAHELGVLLGLAVWALVPTGYALGQALFREESQLEAEAVALETKAEPAASTRFVGHAIVISMLTLVSRFTGLARDAVLAAVFGLSSVSDAFFIGFLVPNLFRRLFGEGALTAAFIPHYTDLRKHDPETARRFASLCLILLAVLLAGLTLVGELALWLLAAQGWGESTSLALHLTMLMLPYMPMICLVAMVGGILQVHHRFGPPAAAPVLLNLTMIGFTLWAGFADGRTQQQIAFWVAISVLVAGGLQLVWQLIALRQSTSLTLDFRGTAKSLRSMLLMMLPMLMGLAVFQINALMDSLIAFGLSPHNGMTTFNLWGRVIEFPIQTGSVAALNWAQRLYQFPLGVFGIAVATAIFPALSHAVSHTSVDGGEQFRTILRNGLRLTVFIGLPASVGIVMLREPIVRLIYERGEFSAQDVGRVATILAGYASSIWAYSMMHVLTRAFYAHKDSATPLKISVTMVVVNLALNVSLIWKLGAAGLAWSTAISGALQAVILLVMLRKHVASPLNSDVWKGWLRTAALSAVMAAALYAMMQAVDATAISTTQLVGWLAALVSVGGGIILGGTWLTGGEEVRWLVKRSAR